MPLPPGAGPGLLSSSTPSSPKPGVAKAPVDQHGKLLPAAVTAAGAMIAGPKSQPVTPRLDNNARIGDRGLEPTAQNSDPHMGKSTSQTSLPSPPESANDLMSPTAFLDGSATPQSGRPLAPLVPKGGRIIVIGAGLAGLAAARALKDVGYKVKVLEGTIRIERITEDVGCDVVRRYCSLALC